MTFRKVLNNPCCDPRMPRAFVSLVQSQGLVTNTAAELVNMDLTDTHVSVTQIEKRFAMLQSLHESPYVGVGNALPRRVLTDPPACGKEKQTATY